MIPLLALNRDWEPVGEGAIAQSADRVLQGEVPHPDFDDVYTEAFTYLHAARWHCPRAGLRVNPDDAALCGALLPRVRTRGGNGNIWAGPDAPAAYFLAGNPNHPRAVVDFLGGSDSSAIALIARDHVRAVVLNLRPSFSPRVGAELLDLIRSGFPYGESIGRFELRWRQ